MKILRFELFPGHTLHVLLFEVVENIHAIRDRLFKAEFELSLMNTDLVLLNIFFSVLLCVESLLYSRSMTSFSSEWQQQKLCNLRKLENLKQKIFILNYCIKWAHRKT